MPRSSSTRKTNGAASVQHGRRQRNRSANDAQSKFGAGRTPLRPESTMARGVDCRRMIVRGTVADLHLGTKATSVRSSRADVAPCVQSDVRVLRIQLTSASVEEST